MDEHQVQLSRQAVTLLKQIQAISGESVFVFPSVRSLDKPMSENTINKALRTIGYDTKTEICGHSFRTMAYNALMESGLRSLDAVENQMNHQERNSIRIVYSHKEEYLDSRKEMMLM